MPRTISETDAAAVAAEGFVFGYPLVLAHRLKSWMTAVGEPDPARMRAPLNTFVHARAVPAAVGRPARRYAGTLRSSAWLDLGPTPLILSVPETHGRFYALSLVDAWTNVVASVGARTTGAGRGTFVIAGPGSSDALFPTDAFPIRSSTRIARIAGSTQVDGEGGRAGAHAVQDAYELAPLVPRRAAGGAPAPPPSRLTPTVQVEQLDAPTFFSELAVLMRDNPAQLEDRALVDRMRRLGLLDEGGGGVQRLGEEIRRAVEHGAALGLARVLAAAESPPAQAAGGWRIRYRLGEYGTDYLARAAAACAGLEAGPAADELAALAHADGEGCELDGGQRYVLEFPAGELPPVHGFWNLATFDARQGLVDNPVERYAVADWNSLVLDADGRIQIRIQHADPGPEASNWLPAPPSSFNLLLRLCWPEQQVLERRWWPPAVRRVAT